MNLFFIIGSIFIAILVVVFLIFYFYRDKNGANKLIKCLAINCEINFKKDNDSNKYCQFHSKIKDLNILFVKEKHPLSKKTLMYLGLNGMQFYNNGDKIIEKLNNEYNKK